MRESSPPGNRSGAFGEWRHVHIMRELAAYHDGALPPRRMRHLAAHIATCAVCQAHLATFAQADAALLAAPQPSAPPLVRMLLARRIAAASAAPALQSQLPPPREDHIAMATNTPRQQRGNTQPRFVVAALAALLIVVLAFAVFRTAANGKNSPGATNTTSSAHATPTLGTPGTTDVVAYLGADHHLHFVTATGHNTTGPALPQTAFIDTTQNAWPTLVAGTSADGRYIGYIASDQGNGIGSVDIYDITTHKLTQIPAHANALYVAPTGARFVTNVATGAQFPASGTSLTVGDAATGQAHTITLTHAGTAIFEDRILGWSDANHVIVMAEPPAPTSSAAVFATATSAHQPAAAPASGGPSALWLAKVDVNNGHLSMITAVSLNSPIEPFLTGDGTEVWLAPTSWTSTTSVIDLATGQTRNLPGIAQAFTGQLQQLNNVGFTQSGNWATHFAIIPGTHTFMVSLSRASIPNEGATSATQDAGVWRVDLDQDQATRLEHGHYPLSVASDGVGLFVCDVPAFQPYMMNSGFVTGPTLGFFAPVSPAGKITTLATTMIAYFGLVAPGA